MPGQATTDQTRVTVPKEAEEASFFFHWAQQPVSQGLDYSLPSIFLPEDMGSSFGMSHVFSAHYQVNYLVS